MNLENSSPQVADISKIVADSQANNSENGGPSPELVKRGRGRPRKGGAPNKATVEKLRLVQNDVSGGAHSSTGPEAATGEDQHSSTESPPPVGPQFEIPTPMLVAALKTPSAILRAKTGYDGFQLDDGTAEGLAPLLDHVIKQYMPAVDSKHAPAITLLGTLAAVTGQQYLDYLKWKSKQAPVPPASPVRAAETFKNVEGVNLNDPFFTVGAERAQAN